MPFVSSLSILGLGFLNYSGVIAESPVIQCSLRSWASVLVITDTTRPKNLGTIDGRYVGFFFVCVCVCYAFSLTLRFVMTMVGCQFGIENRGNIVFFFFEFTSDFNLCMGRARVIILKVMVKQ